MHCILVYWYMCIIYQTFIYHLLLTSLSFVICVSIFYHWAAILERQIHVKFYFSRLHVRPRKLWLSDSFIFVKELFLKDNLTQNPNMSGIKMGPPFWGRTGGKGRRWSHPPKFPFHLFSPSALLGLCKLPLGNHLGSFCKMHLWRLTGLLFQTGLTGHGSCIQVWSCKYFLLAGSIPVCFSGNMVITPSQPRLSEGTDVVIDSFFLLREGAFPGNFLPCNYCFIFPNTVTSPQ